MHFAKLGSLLSFAATALAGSLTFVSTDNVDRDIYFTANAGIPDLPMVQVLGGDTVKVTFPTAWIGNAYAVPSGSPPVPGMLAEIAFDSWQGETFFDVSAIVNPGDHNGVHTMFPTEDPSSAFSGCLNFDCNTAYYLPDDVQTVGTSYADLTVTLGSNGLNGLFNKRDEASDIEHPKFPRSFVERGY
jgi:hypothetical protein